MSFRNELLRGLMIVYHRNVGLDAMTDEDFAFLDMCRNYAETRGSKRSDLTIDWDKVKPNTSTIAPAQPQPSTELDRGPEPQSFGDLIDTSAPQPADAGEMPRSFRDGPGSTAQMPDYETIDTTAPADKS